MPGGRQPVSGWREGQRVHQHAAVPAAGVGHEHQAPQGCGNSQGDAVPPQMGTGAVTVGAGSGLGRASAPCPSGCGVRRRPRVSRGRAQTRPALPGGSTGKTQGVAPGAKLALPPKEPGKNGRPRTRYVAAGVEPWSIEQLSLQVPREEFRTVSWREGSRSEQSSRFAVVRVHTAERHVHRAPPCEEVWLLIEWPKDEKAPTKYSLCSLPADTPLKKLVYLAKLRWRVERDYQELKGGVGLDHFEGRTWRGFHHRAPLCMVAHGFLALRRALFPRRPLPALPAPHQLPCASSGPSRM